MSSPTVVSDRFDRESDKARRRELRTPEGVPLVFTIAPAGDRIAAFVVDLLWILLFGVGILVIATVRGSPWVVALAYFAFFLLRNGYFMWFELRWQGRTPGKKRAGCRVADAGGGALAPDQVVVRNLTREVELFLPLVVLSHPEVIVSAGPGWVKVLAALWLGVFFLLPLLDRDRRRIGDLLAGTIVVREPRTALRKDLLAAPARAEELAFTRAQLAMYGVYELQVLEELLRKDSPRADALASVAESVRRKIAWTPSGAEPEPRAFLEAFYRAQRARLERDLVLGKARERKREGRLGESD